MSTLNSTYQGCLCHSCRTLAPVLVLGKEEALDNSCERTVFQSPAVYVTVHVLLAWQFIVCVFKIFFHLMVCTEFYKLHTGICVTQGKTPGLGKTGVGFRGGLLVCPKY